FIAVPAAHQVQKCTPARLCIRQARQGWKMDRSRSPVLGSLVVPSQQATAINSVGRRHRYGVRRSQDRRGRHDCSSDVCPSHLPGLEAGPVKEPTSAPLRPPPPTSEPPPPYPPPPPLRGS